jgi:Fe-S cluster assembly iron-binding protein IscA
MEISEDAVDALRDLGAIRISAEESGDEIELSIENAEGPQPGDEVVERGGATVYLDAAAAEALADQVLGVEPHGDHVHFTFDEQDSAA